MPYARRRAVVPGVGQPGVRGALRALGPRRARRLTPAQVAFLDSIERSIRSITHVVDNAALMQLQAQYVLDRDGFYVVREVPMGREHRVDLVVLRRGMTAAIELDRFNPRTATWEKFQAMPEGVLRVLVLRRRISPVSFRWLDRTVCLRGSLQMVASLCDGRTTDIASVDAQHRDRGVVIPLREHILVPGEPRRFRRRR